MTFKPFAKYCKGAGGKRPLGQAAAARWTGAPRGSPLCKLPLLQGTEFLNKSFFKRIFKIL